MQNFVVHEGNSDSQMLVNITEFLGNLTDCEVLSWEFW